MKTKLTKKQVNLIEEVKNEYLAAFNSLKFDEGMAKRHIEFLYEMNKEQKPEILVMDSPYAMQAKCREMENKILKPDEKKTERFYFSYGDVFDYNWVAFYDYFFRAGLLPKNELFEKFKANGINGAWFVITLKGMALIGRPPIELNRDEKGRLHCLAKSAIRFKDGHELFFVDGINISKKMFEDVFINKTMLIKDILTLQNAELRAVLIKYVGIDKFIGELDAKKIDEFMHAYKDKQYKYTLWDVGLAINYIEVPNYSDDRRFLLGVPKSCKTAKEAVAWTYSENENAYWLELKNRT